ncbi:hypothetical protein JTE90_016821 [Oedothorax gibbosus]|uniref:Uncharacterized protein n=1 Tax=Oedothorax gibbosus TaxID=931172 RepID=A0AAV6VX43_9ARAC|nr:hypothetical protein JTE90_016821 [Oedothorax gibbosus]
MGLGKRDNDAIKKSYDPAFQYMGLGKRDNADIYETDKKKSYDPAFKYMGLGKRKYAEIGSKRDSYDPAFKYMGLGKRINNVVNSNHGSNYSFNRLMWFVNNPEFIHKELGFDKIGMTKKGSFDPAFKNIAIGKRTEIIRRKSSFDPALKYMGLGKRNRNTNWVTYANHQNSSFPKPYYTNKQNEESKTSSYNEPALHYMGLGKSDYGIQGSSTRDYNVHSKPISYAKANQRIKRSGNYDPALQYMGLGKRDNLLNDNSASSSFNQLYLSKPSSLDTPETSEQFKRSSYYDPALQYMGLGKRGSLKQGKYDPALQFLGLGKRKNELKVAAKMTQSKELDPMSTKFSIPLQNTNYPEFKDDFSTDIRPSKTVFYESKRSKREIEREDTEPDEKPDYDDYDEYFDPEAYPKLHRIDNIDNPHGITIFNGNLSDKHDDFDLVFDYDESPVFADCEGSETPCNEETKETTLYGGSPKKYGDKAKTNKKPFPNGYPIVPTEEKQEMQLPDMETSLSSTTTKPLHMGEELIPHRRPGTPYSYFTDPRKKRNLDEDIFPIVTRTTRQVKLSGKPYPFHNNRLKKRSQVKTHATISSDTDIEVKRSANSYLYVHNHRKKGDLSQVQTPAIISAGVASRINRSDTPYAHHNRNKRGLREFKKQRSTLLKPRFKSPKSNFGDTNPTLMKKLNQKIEVGVPVVKARAQNYKVKRSIGEIDMNRPRYNPGWVFIGLGKRSQGGGKVVQDKVDSRMSLITKCYQLLRKVNDAFRGIAGPRLAEAEPFWMANVHGKNMKGFQNFKKWKNE